MAKIKVVVSGEAGSGKSTLITILCDELRQLGAKVTMPADIRNFDLQKPSALAIDWSKYDIEFEETR